MRIDQFLWCIRLFKSRNLATNACKKGHIRINEQTVKPSREVLPTDVVWVRKEQIWRSFEVLDIPKSRMGAKWVNIYCMETTPKEAFELQEFQALSRVLEREKGTGRPTKKDRRSIDILKENKPPDSANS